MIAAIGELVVERSGVLNLGVEGMMIMGAVIGFARGAVGRIAQLLSMTFLVFLIMAFMLSEATVFQDKFHYITGISSADEDRLAKVLQRTPFLGIFR